MIKAYVLIVTNPGDTNRVADAIRQLDHIAAVHVVMGPYDIVAEIEVESLADIPPILSERIRRLDGIQSTTSLVAFPGE